MNVRNVFEKFKSQQDFEIATHISLKNNYVFIQISKSGSSNVKYHLQSSEFQSSPWSVINVNNKWFSPHLSPYQLSDEALNDVFYSDKYKRVSFVRNPYSRLLSCYLHRIIAEPDSPSNIQLKRANNGVGGNSVSFDEFIEIVCSQSSVDQEAHWRCQSDDLAFDFIKYDYIGKLENFDSDLSKMMSVLYKSEQPNIYDQERGLDKSPMKTGSSEKVKRYYSDSSTRKRVMDRYEQDFRNFNYPLELL